jgi:hypothetical protein
MVSVLDALQNRANAEAKSKEAEQQADAQAKLASYKELVRSLAEHGEDSMTAFDVWDVLGFTGRSVDDLRRDIELRREYVRLKAKADRHAELEEKSNHLCRVAVGLSDTLDQRKRALDLEVIEAQGRYNDASREFYAADKAKTELARERFNAVRD